MFAACSFHMQLKLESDFIFYNLQQILSKKNINCPSVDGPPDYSIVQAHSVSFQDTFAL